MKMNNKQKMKIIVIGLLTVMLGAFTHCMPHEIQVGTSNNSSSYSPKPNNNNPTDEGQIIHQTQVTTGVKNHEQILASMGAVTGIDPYTVNSIMTIYRQVELTLPTGNDVKTYSSSQQVAVAKLASEFCAILAGNQSLRDQVWPGLNFGGNPNTSLNQANRTAFIDNTIISFWGGMISSEEAQMAHEELNILMNDLIGSDTNAAATQRAVRGVCIATLSSAYVTIL